jgi:hypothetical protein
MKIFPTAFALATLLCACSQPPPVSYRYGGTMEDAARQIDDVRPNFTAPSILPVSTPGLNRQEAPAPAEKAPATADSADMKALNQIVDDIAAESRKLAEERKNEVPPIPASKPEVAAPAKPANDGWWYFTNRRAIRGGYEWDVWDRDTRLPQEKSQIRTGSMGTLRIRQENGAFLVEAPNPAVRNWVVEKLKLETLLP